MSKLRPPVKTHGGKRYLREWIISHFPKGYHALTYCEPFCGGASVFLNKKKSQREIISDLDKGVISIFRMLKRSPRHFIDSLENLEYKESVFLEEKNKVFTDYDVMERAIHEYVLRRMSRGGMKETFAWSERLRGGLPGDLNAWNTMLEVLPKLADRVKDTTILNQDFREVMADYDRRDLLLYLDPPYLTTTRSKGSGDIYSHEMSEKAHREMLELCNISKGKVVISGYYSELYKNTLKNWNMVKKEIPNHSSQSKSKERREECLWFNY